MPNRTHTLPITPPIAAPTGTLHAEGSAAGQPTWEIAYLFPRQGEWTEEQYFEVEERARCEFIDGRIEFLPIPNTLHQFILDFLIDCFKAALSREQYAVWPSGTVVRLRVGLFRKPDIVVIAKPARSVPIQRAIDAEDVALVVEIVSVSNRENDVKHKLREYAEAGIEEYWIVDPDNVTVSRLYRDPGATEYTEHTFTTADRAVSLQFPSVQFSVADVLRRGPDGTPAG